jgi:transposase
VSSPYDVGTAGNVSAPTIRSYIERLPHIRKRIQAGLRVRSRPHCWALRQLQDFVACTAAHTGGAALFADPACISKICTECCQIESQVQRCFPCNCGRRAHSDVNAASNHALLGERAPSPRVDVTRPDVEETGHVGL